MLPLLFMHLPKMAQAVPFEIQQHLGTEYQRNVFHSLANTAELIAVLKEFDQEGIPAMPFKGVVLAASVYRDLNARPAGDLDVLIRPTDLSRATAVLLNRGYELKTDVQADGSPAATNSYEYHFERKQDGMVMELRWRLELTQPRFRRNLGLDWVWPSHRTALLAGAEVPDMNPEMNLLVLCMHGSKHVWCRLIWVCDVAQLLRSHPDFDWQAVIRESKRSGLWRALAIGVLLVHRMTDIEVPEPVLLSFKSDATANRLALHIAANMFDAPGSTPRSRIPYKVLLLGFDDRMRMVLSLDFLRPNERDRAAVRLPRSLHVLYYLVRPFRILRDRSAR